MRGSSAPSAGSTTYKNQALLVRAMAPLLSSQRAARDRRRWRRRAPTVEAAVARAARAALGRDDRPPHGRAAPDARVRRVRAVVEDRRACRSSCPRRWRPGCRSCRPRSAASRRSSTRARPGCSFRSRRRALRGALQTLIDDPARARAMGARAREVALERYSYERMVDAYLALYQNAMYERGSWLAARARTSEYDVVAQQAQVARRGERDAIAGAAQQLERARRLRRRHELIEHDVGLAPTSPRRCRAPRSAAAPRARSGRRCTGRSTRAPVRRQVDDQRARSRGRRRSPSTAPRHRSGD